MIRVGLWIFFFILLVPQGVTTAIFCLHSTLSSVFLFKFLIEGSVLLRCSCFIFLKYRSDTRTHWFLPSVAALEKRIKKREKYLSNTLSKIVHYYFKAVLLIEIYPMLVMSFHESNFTSQQLEVTVMMNGEMNRLFPNRNKRF